MTHQAPNPGDPNYDWSDPHGFHHDTEGHETHGHHVSSLRLLVLVLAALCFFTLLTVWVAAGESLVIHQLGIPITQLTNVLIAMGIASVKAYLVMAYFMHLKHDTPLNTYIMLFTFAVLALFLTFPALDLGNRGLITPYKDEVPSPGGSGVGVNIAAANGDGESALSGNIVDEARNRAIAEMGPKDFWFTFYKKDLEHAAKYGHGLDHVHRFHADESDYFSKWLEDGTEKGAAYLAGKMGLEDHAGHGSGGVSSPDERVVRTGITEGLFDEHTDHSDDSHAGDDH
ncbi:MAG: cytochrome C oxidase subunit IV family protein [Planctomycetota bacterium]